VVHLQGYVHRVGRTGRAGQSGLALTLFTPQDNEFRQQLQQALQAQQQSVAAAGGAASGGGSSSSSSDDDSSDSEDDEEGGAGRASKRKAAQDGQVSMEVVSRVEVLFCVMSGFGFCWLFACLRALTRRERVVASGWRSMGIKSAYC
jgi:superfamily II DNA/RNA helicase